MQKENKFLVVPNTYHMDKGNTLLVGHLNLIAFSAHTGQAMLDTYVP